MGFASCNKGDFYQKEYLDNPFQNPTSDGTVNGGGQAGIDSGSVSDPQDGLTTSGFGGGTTGGSSGSVSGGSYTGSSTTGGVDGSISSGSTTGSSVGGTDGTNSGGSTGSSTGGTTTIVHESTEEIFHQTASQTKKLDIIWIIDNSGSMADEQQALGINFSSFIDDFITKNVDFKMGITTTDTSSPALKGRIVPGSDTKLTSVNAKANESQFKSDFKNLIKVGTSGSGHEKGLEASQGFMERYGTSFIRPDAYLVFVILSDEEDQSSGTVSLYTDYLKSFKSDAGLVKVYSIVDVFKTNCCQSGISTGAERYIWASKNTGAVFSDIRNDFHSSLSAMGDQIINLLDSFPLANDPLVDSLKVYVNEVLSSDYTFDAVSRSIKFDANHLPPVGAEIKVKYQKK